jgi:hypothetical protein
MLEALEAAQVENVFVVGWFLVSIAEVLRISKQAVHKKHAKRIRNRYSRETPGRKRRVSDLQPFRQGDPQVRGDCRGGG